MGPYILKNTFQNYKKWAIQQRITELIAAIRHHPNSPFRAKREAELEQLKKELDD